MRLMLKASGWASLAVALNLYASTVVAQEVIPPELPVAPGMMGPDGAYKVGNGVAPPAALTKVGPEIPDLARKLRAQGEVLVSMVVQSSGSLRDIHVVKSAGYGMDEKAVEAVRKWRFRAGTKDGAAVDVRVQAEVSFRLEPEPRMWGAGPLRFDVEAGGIPPCPAIGHHAEGDSRNR